MKSLEDLDRWIGGMVRRWTSKAVGAPHGLESLEIRREILMDIRTRIEPRGNGERFFPFNTIAIQAPAAFAGDDSLEQDIRELLNEAGCRVPASLTVTVEQADDSAAPFRVDYSRSKSVAPAVAPRPAAKLVVLRGRTETQELAIAADRVNIGRLKEVTGERGGLRRRNDLAFDETEISISREQASIRYDAASGGFRLYDYLSQRPTVVLREGRLIEVPRDAARGVQLKSGDEIHMGEARLRFEIS